ncbi:hypothetical protein F5882DRAFT_522703 [Hyaloscypha sp. PMI_1271]|nr:hypothetical protein F5882DRAFT_522703 [Hyaloscypha sp. PMI_1271]
MVKPPAGPPPPEVPEGWKAHWNQTYKAWFYENFYTEDTVWVKPTEPVYPPGPAGKKPPAGPPPGFVDDPAALTNIMAAVSIGENAPSPQPEYFAYSPQPTYGQQPQYATPPPIQPAEQEKHGLMGMSSKLSGHSSPAAGAKPGMGALGGAALGGGAGLLAGSLIAHEWHEHEEKERLEKERRKSDSSGWGFGGGHSSSYGYGDPAIVQETVIVEDNDTYNDNSDTYVDNGDFSVDDNEDDNDSSSSSADNEGGGDDDDCDDY